MSVEQTVNYIDRYLKEEYGEHIAVRYVDIDSNELQQYPLLAEAVGERRQIPLVLVGQEVKSPGVLSFPWVVNQFRSMGVLR